MLKARVVAVARRGLGFSISDQAEERGRERERSLWLARTGQQMLVFLAFLYALMFAFLNLAQAIGHRLTGLVDGVERLAHIEVWQGNAAFPAILGAFMLLIVYQLWHRKKAALVVLCGFIILQAAVQAFRGAPRAETVVTVVLGALPLLALREFSGKPDPVSFARARKAIPVLLVVFFTFGMTGLYLLERSLNLKGAGTVGLASRSLAVVAGTSGLQFTGWGAFYRDTLIIFALLSVVYITVLVFRPYRETAARKANEEPKALELVKRYGSDSLAYFNTRSDKSIFLDEDMDSFIAYRRIGDMAVISGDPVGPTDRIADIIEKFREYCGERGWRFFSFSASADHALQYSEAGMKTWVLGEEAIIDVTSFTLEGRKVRKLRQSVNKLEKMGVTMEFMYNASIPSHMKHELVQISADWRGDKPETGFAMGLGRLLSSEDPDCLLAVAYDAEMEPIGFLYFVPMYPLIGYSLDITRTKVGAPNALSEFMLCNTARFLKSQGYQKMSMHFLAMSQHYRDDRTEPGSRIWRKFAQVVDRAVPVVSMYAFDKKFYPTWKERAIVYNSLLDFPAIGVATVAAEKALSLARAKERSAKHGQTSEN